MPHLVAAFDDGDSGGRVSAVIADVEAVEHFKEGSRLRVKEYDNNITDLHHVREFTVTTNEGHQLIYWKRTDDDVNPVGIEENEDGVTKF